MTKLSMVLFCSDDTPVRFHGVVCGDDNLPLKVQEAMWPGTAKLDSEQLEERDQLVEQLVRHGDVSFEDGWMALRVGVQDVLAFLIGKIDDAIVDREYHDQQRYVELQRRVDAEKRYSDLSACLRLALDMGFGIKYLNDALEELEKARVRRGRPAAQEAVMHADEAAAEFTRTKAEKMTGGNDA